MCPCINRPKRPQGEHSDTLLWAYKAGGNLRKASQRKRYFNYGFEIVTAAHLENREREESGRRKSRGRIWRMAGEDKSRQSVISTLQSRTPP